MIKEKNNESPINKEMKGEKGYVVFDGEKYETLNGMPYQVDPFAEEMTEEEMEEALKPENLPF